MHHAHRRFDPHHFDHRLWALGRAYPHGCRWGRCGYWWWAMAIGISTTTL